MLIVTYAYARASGDGGLISRYVRIRTARRVPINDQRLETEQYHLLTAWADYLSSTTLFIHDQCVISVNDYDISLK